jgi:spore protease
MLKKYARTDLAMEISENLMKNNVDIKGVEIYEDMDESGKIRTTVVNIVDEVGAKKMGRDKGTYITIENIDVYDSCSYDKDKLIGCLRENIILLAQGKKGRKKIKASNILIVGLGNDNITPDSLGPRVINNIHVTRGIEGECGIMAIAPGVMGQTGMEVKEIIYAIVREIDVDLVVVIDALAARSIYRLNNTIQLTNTGISPGSGVGNNRAEISKKTIGVDVIAIGVPTVVDIFSLVEDMLNNTDNISETYSDKMLGAGIKNTFVTSKYVDLMIAEMSDIISQSINLI